MAREGLPPPYFWLSVPFRPEPLRTAGLAGGGGVPRASKVQAWRVGDERAETYLRLLAEVELRRAGDQLRGLDAAAGTDEWSDPGMVPFAAAESAHWARSPPIARSSASSLRCASGSARPGTASRCRPQRRSGAVGQRHRAPRRAGARRRPRGVRTARLRPPGRRRGAVRPGRAQHGRRPEPPARDQQRHAAARRRPIPAVLDDLLLVADNAVLVQEASIIAGMRMLLDHAGLVAEPPAALGIAAILEDRDRFAGRHVVTIVCGSNVDLDACSSRE